MQNSRYQALAARFTPSRLRTSLRSRSSSTNSASSRISYSSSRSDHTYSSDRSASPTSMSPKTTINSVIVRQPSILNLQEEKRAFGGELDVLEPRPIVYWGGVEERMGSLNF